MSPPVLYFYGYSSGYVQQFTRIEKAINKKVKSFLLRMIKRLRQDIYWRSNCLSHNTCSLIEGFCLQGVGARLPAICREPAAKPGHAECLVQPGA
jgi:hypothetical protein